MRGKLLLLCLNPWLNHMIKSSFHTNKLVQTNSTIHLSHISHMTRDGMTGRRSGRNSLTVTWKFFFLFFLDLFSSFVVRRRLQLNWIWIHLLWIVELNHMDSAESGQAWDDPHVDHRFIFNVQIILNLFPSGACENSSDKQDDEDCTDDEDEGDVGSWTFWGAHVKTKITAKV